MPIPKIVAAGATVLLLAACDAGDGTGDTSPAAPVPANMVAPEPSTAPDPGPLPADAGPAEVVRHYYALIGQRRFADAWRLWGGGGQASGRTADAFAASFADVARYTAKVSAPAAVEGAAGSLYATVPVEVTGEKADGTPIHIEGDVTLRRVNDVPGSTAEQRRWHISGAPG